MEPVYFKFSHVNWRDPYSAAGYFAQWAIKQQKPEFNHVAIGWDDTYYALSCNKGVCIELVTPADTLVAVDVSRDYVTRIVDIYLHNHIRYGLHNHCVSFAATCAGLHMLQFTTADNLYDAVSAT